MGCCQTWEQNDERVGYLAARLTQGAVNTGESTLTASCGCSFRWNARCRCLKGWNRTQPQGTNATAGRNGRVGGHHNEALAGLLARPSAGLRLQSRRLIPPFHITWSPHWSLILCPMELGHPSQTGDYDWSKASGLTRHQWRFGRAVTVMRFECVGFRLYSLNHEGVSHAVATHSKDLLAVLKRGQLER